MDESAMRVLKGDNEIDRQRIISLLGLNSRDDEVVWLKDNLGLQSNCFLLKGNRWKGLGKQPIVDTTVKSTVFVKMLPQISVQDMVIEMKQRARIKAEDDARILGKTESEIQQAGQEASDQIASIAFVDPSIQLLRERHVLRVFNAADDAGELKIPKDSLLVLPRLIDIKRSEEEEKKPTMLILEDLTAAGFETRKYTEALPLEDALAVAAALADFHAVLWRIQDRLGFQTSRLQNVDSDSYEANLRQCLDSFRKINPAYAGFADQCEPFVDHIVNAFTEIDIEPIILGHGDGWAHNVMLRRDKFTRKVNGVAFVDLGCVRMMSPVEDFYCFLGTMMDGKILKSGKDELRSAYQTRVQDQLGAILCDEDKINLFVGKRVLHALAVMLSIFFSNETWTVFNEAGEDEPHLRQLAAFRAACQTTYILQQEGILTGKKDETFGHETVRRRNLN